MRAWRRCRLWHRRAPRCRPATLSSMPPRTAPTPIAPKVPAVPAAAGIAELGPLSAPPSPPQLPRPLSSLRRTPHASLFSSLLKLYSSLGRRPILTVSCLPRGPRTQSIGPRTVAATRQDDSSTRVEIHSTHRLNPAAGVQDGDAKYQHAAQLPRPGELAQAAGAPHLERTPATGAPCLQNVFRVRGPFGTLSRQVRHLRARAPVQLGGSLCSPACLSATRS